MIITFLGELETLKEHNIEVNSFKQLLAGIQHIYGIKVIEKLFTEKYYYFLYSEKLESKFVALNPAQLEIDFSSFERIYIISDVTGEVPAVFIAGLLSVSLSTVTLASIGVYALTALINIAISFAISAIVQAITPTPSFKGDVAKAQLTSSSLFNGPLLVNEQGGPVPLIFGWPFCGGVVLASSITTEQVI